MLLMHLGSFTGKKTTLGTVYYYVKFCSRYHKYFMLNVQEYVRATAARVCHKHTTI
jgi:hypothetical protein